MNRSIIGWGVAAVLALAGSTFAYVFYFAGGTGEPSTELTTPNLAAVTTSSTLPDVTTTTSSPDVEPRSATFVIEPEQSEARFELDEVLRGSPTHVTGTTDQVAGQFRLDLDDPSSVEFSEIVINARTLTTDSDRRDRAIRGPVILDSASDAHELITFEVASVDGLEGPVAVGDSVSFRLVGNLTVKGETNEETFEVEAVLVDESTITGTATTTVLRSDYGIGIPNVPSVADVTDEVLLTLEFTAVSD